MNGNVFKNVALCRAIVTTATVATEKMRSSERYARKKEHTKQQHIKTISMSRNLFYYVNFFRREWLMVNACLVA